MYEEFEAAGTNFEKVQASPPRSKETENQAQPPPAYGPFSYRSSVPSVLTAFQPHLLGPLESAFVLYLSWTSAQRVAMSQKSKGSHARTPFVRVQDKQRCPDPVMFGVMLCGEPEEM